MNHLRFTVVLALITILFGQDQEITIEDLYERGGLFYAPNQDSTFNGTVAGNWESGIKKLDYTYKDGKRDLWNNKYDIYASIANYLVANGWKKNGTIFSNIVVKKEFEEILLKRGDSKTISAGKFLKSINLETDQLDKILVNYNKTKEKKKYLILLSSKNKKYKLGYTNFKVIMRYNPSTYYAMCVSQLSKRISEGL